MKMYADQPARRARQVLADLLFVAACVGLLLVCAQVQERINSFGEPSAQVSTSSAELGRSLQDTADLVGLAPGLDAASKPIQRGANASASISTAAGNAGQQLPVLARLIGGLAAVLGLAVIGLIYLPSRVRFVRQATAGRDWLRSGGGVELLALQGLARLTPLRIAEVHPDPVDALRDADMGLLRELALLDLADRGLDLARYLPTDGEDAR